MIPNLMQLEKIKRVRGVVEKVIKHKKQYGYYPS